MRIGVINYGVGNLGSIRNAFAALGHIVHLECEPSKLMEYDKLILPGVGAFGDACDMIRKQGFDEAIREFAKNGRYILGICLGMQLLFEKSYEFGEHFGLALLKGEIVRFANAPRVPHIGWNQCLPTRFGKNHPILKGLEAHKGIYLYFVHSYHAVADSKEVFAVCEYGDCFPAIVGYENIFGIQPHPEKSHNIGLQLLHNFLML